MFPHWKNKLQASEGLDELGIFFVYVMSEHASVDLDRMFAK